MGVATVMWYAEGEAQPDEFGSIIRAFYFTFMTLSTIGYGDVVPVTIFGKVATTITSLIAIFLFAMPTSILGSALIEQFERKRQNQQELVKKKMAMRQRRAAIRNKRAKFIREKLLANAKELERKESLVRQDSIVNSETYASSNEGSDIDSEVDSVVHSSGTDDDDEEEPTRLIKNVVADRPMATTPAPLGKIITKRSTTNTPSTPVGSSSGGGGGFYGCPHCGKGIGVQLTTSSGTVSSMVPTHQPVTDTPTLSGTYNEESPEELWALFKKHRGGITIKEFQRGMKEYR
eukprot:CAMPEP_0117432722 /NCGR_PEP_ID=MMETSP0758-20121206/12158_1 /TAXON_ID=63605 /ORGANISM="Percolomonas cosmopolitus, Strain AE-1 (ATCC 50343)" /LENGTH=289 /DNA_ID=CAMNT_0005222819 /DNA_START=296 /DNA_END=1161 /DNA_ORIENTATION=+